MALESGSSMCAFGQDDTEWFLDVLDCVQKRRTGLFLSDWSDSEWGLAGWTRRSPEHVENDSVKNENK